MDTEQLEQRLARIERQNLFLKRAGAGALVLVWLAVALSLLAGVLRDDRVEANQFTLADDEGNPRAIWAHGAGDGYYLIFYDRQQRERAVFGVTHEGRPVLGIMGTDEKARLAFEVDLEGDPQLGLFDDDRKLRAALKVSGGEQPKLSLLDANQTHRAVVQLNRYGEPEVLLFDEEGRPTRRIASPHNSDTQ